MTITSAQYFLFISICLVLYYGCFSRRQWFLLLAASLAFYYICTGKGIIVLLCQTAIAYFGARAVAAESEKAVQKRKLTLTIALLVSVLALFRYLPFFGQIISFFTSREVTVLNTYVIGTIGLSYFTLSLIGYVVDVYWESYDCEMNYWKLLLYAGYFPQMTSGPITQFGKMKETLFASHSFDSDKVLRGFERLLWGLLKKMVIADRMAIFISLVHEHLSEMHPLLIIASIILFSFRLYFDFSGCMDIIMGTSEMFGIMLPENFNIPFMSQSVSEFWRRWHISMGTWFKSYVLYPLQKSAWFQSIEKKLKKTHHKQLRRLPTYFLLLIMWIVIGIWHGGDAKYIVGSGLCPWVFLVLEQVFSGKKSAHVSPVRMVGNMIRTFLCVAFGEIFVSADSVGQGFTIIKSVFANSWGVINVSLLAENDIGKRYFLVLLIGIVISALVDVAMYNGIDLRGKLNGRNIYVRYAAMLAVCLVIIIFGVYGPGYHAADFIYKNF